jgi:hypothetical protein
MNAKLVPLCAALALLSSSACADVRSDYDRFKNQTVVHAESSTGVRTSAAYRAITILTLFPGEQPLSTPEAMLITYTFENVTWKYLRCHEVNYLADGKPIQPLTSTHQGKIERGYVTEQIQAGMPWSSAIALAAASKIEVQICGDEHTFSPEEIANLRGVMQAASPK